MALRELFKVTGAPLRGGAVTVREKALLQPGQFSMVQNLRPVHPGFEKRKGCRRLHSEADSTNQAVTGYQFKKTRVSENHFMIQWSDGDIHIATNNPPTVTTGAFGSEKVSLTSTNMKPASWGNLNDMLVYSHASDQHQLWAGTGSYVQKFIVVMNYGSNPTGVDNVFELGFDYTKKVTDGQSSTVAVLDSLDTAANGDCILICTPIPAKSFTFTVSKANGTASAIAGYYWKSDNTWSALSGESDGTSDDSKTMAVSGTLSFTEPTDIQATLNYGAVGYWYMFVVDTQLDSEVEISSVTFDSSFDEIENLWDGVPRAAIEVMVEGTSQFDTYSSDAVNLDELASGKDIYIASTDPIEGIYWDVGQYPNATGTALENSVVYYWDGDSWVSVGTTDDGTSGLSNSGWMRFGRQAAVMPKQFESTAYFAYWYKLAFDTQLSADMQVSIDVMPYFDIHDLGYYGQCSCVWKERAVYTFADKFQEYVYITAPNAPQVLNGDEFAIIEVGDGRPHIQGYNPATFGKLVLSTKLGTFNAKSADIVENVYVATATDETVKTLAFFLSRYGVCMTDGASIAIVSDDIQNYFDPRESECIRRGYEDQHWLKYDPLYRMIRIGIVSGSSATVPNVFLLYDLIDKCWYFDSPAQALAFMENVDAASGNVPVVQVGGGTADGYVYQLNYGTVDVSTDITSYLQVELTGGGHWLDLLWLMIQARTQASGEFTLTTYENGIQKDSITLATDAEITNQLVRRHLLSLNVKDPLISLKFQDATTSGTMYLEVLGMEVRVWENR